jgi:hypothetical protein
MISFSSKVFSLRKNLSHSEDLCAAPLRPRPSLSVTILREKSLLALLLMRFSWSLFTHYARYRKGLESFLLRFSASSRPLRAVLWPEIDKFPFVGGRN